MPILVPWPLPEAGVAFPPQACRLSLEQVPPHEASLWVIETFTPEGFFIEAWENRLWELRQRFPTQSMVLHVTALPPALIFPDTWGLRSLLVHGPTWEKLHGLSLPPLDPRAPYLPQGGWHYISPLYLPPPGAYVQLQALASTLQAWRRTLPALQSRSSTLFYTHADRLYTHFSLKELQTHVATLRR
jgi:hypothetical protein